MALWPRQNPRARRSWVPIVLTILTFTLGIPLGAPAPAHAALAGVERQGLAANRLSQNTPQEAVDKKGVIWLPHAKWATADGFNWTGIESDLQDMKRAGVGWVRIFLRQDLPMSFHDQLVPLIDEYNIQLLPVVKKTDPLEDLGTPEQQETYRQWLTEVVTRYQGTVRYWEIENETNIPQGWAICCHDDPDAQEAYARSVESYVALLKMAYETIKGVDPALQVLIAGICEAGAERYVEELIRLEAYRYFDIMSYHPFANSPEVALQRLDSFKAATAAQPELAAKPIWITAIGYHAQAGWTAPGKVASEEMKADYLLQTMQLMRDAPGVEGPIFWYALTEPTVVHGYGLIQVDPNAEPLCKTYLPAYTALQELWVTKGVQLLPAIADSFVSRNYPTSNYGAAQLLKIGYGTDIRSAYLNFDLTPLAGQTLLAAKLRLQVASTQGAGSATAQNIRMAANSEWTEGNLTYGNQPFPIVGIVSGTVPGQRYQAELDTTTLQRAVGGELSLTIDSDNADELVIQSREWTRNPPRLVIYYTSTVTTSVAAPEIVVASAEELPPIEEISAAPASTGAYQGTCVPVEIEENPVEDGEEPVEEEDPVDDPVEDEEEPVEEEDPVEEDPVEDEDEAQPAPAIYLPFIEQE
jgi:hypothetical protein